MPAASRELLGVGIRDAAREGVFDVLKVNGGGVFGVLSGVGVFGVLSGGGVLGVLTGVGIFGALNGAGVFGVLSEGMLGEHGASRLAAPATDVRRAG